MHVFVIGGRTHRKDKKLHHHIIWMPCSLQFSKCQRVQAISGIIWNCLVRRLSSVILQILKLSGNQHPKSATPMQCWRGMSVKTAMQHSEHLKANLIHTRHLATKELLDYYTDFYWECVGRVQESLKDPEHARGSIYLIWHEIAQGSPRRSWKMLL